MCCFLLHLALARLPALTDDVYVTSVAFHAIIARKSTTALAVLAIPFLNRGSIVQIERFVMLRRKSVFRVDECILATERSTLRVQKIIFRRFLVGISGTHDGDC